MKKGFGFLSTVALILLFVVVIKGFTLKSKQIQSDGKEKNYSIDSIAVNHFAQSIRYPTVSYDDGHRDTTAFQNFLNFIDSSYPLVNTRMELVTINTFTRIYKWKGKSLDLKPGLLYAHYDVVPVEQVNKSEWRHEPFGGEVSKDSIYGRGTIDDKIGVIALLEAAENLLRENFTPARDLYFVFGHDEEIGGLEGAAQAAKYLEEKQVKTQFHFDEGGLVAHGIVPNMNKPVALIGTAEKGYMTLELKVDLKGGHSSKPPKASAIQVLSKAIHQLEEHPFPKTSAQAVEDFIAYVGPEMPQPLKIVFANNWLFKPVILKVYEGSAEGNAMIRTTGVPTIFDAGVKENLIPGSASVKVNFRILSGQTSKEIKEKVRNIVKDERVQIIEMNNTFEPSKTTAVSSYGFQLMQRACAEVFPDAVAAPFLDIGSTDSKHFDKLGGDVLRFLPVRMDNEILGTFHGVNERVKVQDFMQTIAFYEYIMKNAE
ncbi:MAG: M20/M25/M40 family metallo-hydrolase [Chitinophagales bacterium]|nr:M20/M25/M40 family metallo-hydrolase [Chitinophagales bacterium]